MTARLVCLLGALSVATLFAEDADWAIALAGRLRDLRNPVVVTHSLTELATVVCSKDPIGAGGLFREAVSRVNSLPDDAFNNTRELLPISTLSGLWTLIKTRGGKCDPSLGRIEPSPRLRSLMLTEKNSANQWLETAQRLSASNPDRAAQFVDAALTVAEPFELDLMLLCRDLAVLRDRAPDLADQLFPLALEFIESAPAPNLPLLATLGNYLFVAPESLAKDDREVSHKTTTIAGDTIYNHASIRVSSSTDDIRAYTDLALRILATADPLNDPIIAYAIVYPLLQKAQRLFDDLVDKVQQAVDELRLRIASRAGEIEAFLVDTSSSNESMGASAIRREAAVRRILGAIASRRFEEARQMLRDVADAPLERQLQELIQFKDAAASIGAHDAERGTQLANRVSGGIKRSLLYAGIISVANPPAAYSAMSLAAPDAESLPAEQKAFAVSAVGISLLRIDSDNALVHFNRAVAAANDANSRPRRGRFDPKIYRRAFTNGGDSITDASVIVLGQRGAYEVVDTLRSRHNVRLGVPGAEASSIVDFVRAATVVDAKRLEAAILRINDEAARARALVVYAASRIAENPARVMN